MLQCCHTVRCQTVVSSRLMEPWRWKHVKQCRCWSVGRPSSEPWMIAETVLARQSATDCWNTPALLCGAPWSLSVRPISVTSILSRTVEKLVVRNYLMPLLRSSSFYDQYAYKLTGSTTCALADPTHHIHTFLESNQYVRYIQSHRS